MLCSIGVHAGAFSGRTRLRRLCGGHEGPWRLQQLPRAGAGRARGWAEPGAQREAARDGSNRPKKHTGTGAG